jgi:aldose 1-epimerase
MAQVYKCTSELRDGIEVFSLSEGEFAVAEIAPALGNNCFSIYMHDEPVLERVSLHEFVKRPTSYGIPILFPFPNRIRDGKFVFQGETYTVDPPRHGFVRDKPWEVVSHGASVEEGAWLTSGFDASRYTEQILRQFPFPFKLEVTYRLKGGWLEMETTARNTGEKDMPVGFGIHPYFRKPDKGVVRVPANARWELAESLPTGKILPVEEDYDLRNGKSLDGLKLDDIFTGIESDKQGITCCSLENRESGTETVIEFPVEQFPHVVVYTPPLPRQVICVEPNSCPTDAFNLEWRKVESNVITLGSGEVITFNLCFYSQPTGASASI